MRYRRTVRRDGRLVHEADPTRLRGDTKEERFVLHTLQMAIQGALDVASHIVSDERLGEPDTYRELFILLERNGWISEDVADLGEFGRQIRGRLPEWKAGCCPARPGWLPHGPAEW